MRAGQFYYSSPPILYLIQMNHRKIYLMRPFIGPEELAAVQEVFDSKFLTEGAVTAEFEREFASFVGAAHGVAVTSCMAGLVLALQALDIGSGDEVIVPDFTHPATGDCVYQVGADAVLVDVDQDSRNITANGIRDTITDKTRCIIPVSWGGNPIDPEIYTIGKEYGIPILEDAACSAGAMIGQKKVGSLADITCFSFHPRKILTTGEGGMVTTDRDDLAEKMVALKHFGATKDGSFTYHGTNYKMSNILAAIGREQLKKLPGILEDRISKAEQYTALLKGVDGVTPPVVTPGTRHVFQSYCILCEGEGMRDRLKQDLRSVGIETQIGTYALHLEPSYTGVRHVGRMDNSRRLFESLLTLPLHHELTGEDQESVVGSICNTLSGRA